MRTRQRLGAVAAMAVLAVSVTACGSSATSDSTTATPSSSAAPPRVTSGITTAADVFGSACGSLPQGDAPGSLNAMGPQPVATAASTNPLLSTLANAVKDADLVETLNSQKAITVFAPYNPAFDEVHKAMGDDKFNALLRDKNALGNVLKYHVIAQRYNRDGLLTEASVSPLAGGSLHINPAGSTFTITDGSGATATVLCGNIPTSNATVFVIDKVLMPAKG